MSTQAETTAKECDSTVAQLIQRALSADGRRLTVSASEFQLISQQERAHNEQSEGRKENVKKVSLPAPDEGLRPTFLCSKAKTH